MYIYYCFTIVKLTTHIFIILIIIGNGKRSNFWNGRRWKKTKHISEVNPGKVYLCLQIAKINLTMILKYMNFD